MTCGANPGRQTARNVSTCRATPTQWDLMSDAPTRATPLPLTRFAWPGVRPLPGWLRSLEAELLRDPRLRWAAKALLDFACGLCSVLLAIVVVQGPGLASFGAEAALLLGATTGLLIVAADAVGGRYRDMWRYTSIREAIEILVSSMLAPTALAVARALHLLELPLATLVLMGLLMVFSRITVRALRRWQVAAGKARSQQGSLRGNGVDASRRVLIAGAGEHGLSIARDLRQMATRGVELVGFLDDDPAKVGAACNGARVLGPVRDALEIAERYDVSEVIVAMPRAEPAFVRSLVHRLEAAGVQARAVRGVMRFMTGHELHRPGATTLHELLDGVPARDRAAAHGVEPATRRVLVTGGAGYIGSHLVRMLLERGYYVRILDRFDYGRVGIAALHHPRLEIIQGDICNSRDVSRAARDVYGVVALAAIVGDPACNLDPEETINLNYAATKILAETCNFYGVRRLVFASSCSVYGSNSHGWLTERSRLHPVSLYARTRVLSENILLDRRGDVEPVIVRLATVFGLSPRMRFDLVVNTLTARAVVDQRITVMGGNQWRPNVHCRDAARAFTLALEAPAADVAGETFNLGGDTENYTISQLGEMVARIVGDVEVVTQGDTPDPRDYRVSFEKIRRVLGFEPQFSVQDGIREVAAAMRADPALQRHQDPTYHNVQALKQTFSAPRRRRDDFAPARTLAQA